MKKICGFIISLLFIFGFMVDVNAAVKVTTDIAPSFNSDIKDGKLVITFHDVSGLRENNILLYKTDRSNKTRTAVVFKSINGKKQNGIVTDYECTVGNNYLNNDVNYFYAVVVDNGGLKNESFFRVIKKKNGYSKYFAPKVVLDVAKDGSKLNFTSTDTGVIKSLIVKDLNANKTIKTITNKNKSISDSISLSSFVVANGSNKIEFYTEDEDGNTARRSYQIQVTEIKNTSNSTTNSSKKDSSNKEIPADLVSVSKDKILKVLLVGNSYTYYNDYGGILAELARKQGRKLLAVYAVHGGRDVYCIDALKVSVYAWDSRKAHSSSINTSRLEKLYKDGKTKPFYNDVDLVKSSKKGYILKLKDAIKYDWGGLGRAGKWDYVVLQNHYKGEMGSLKKSGVSVKSYCNAGSSKRKSYEHKDSASQYTKYVNESNNMIYDMVDNGLGNDKSKFIVLRTFATDWESHTSSNNYMKESAASSGFSFIDARLLAKKITGDKKEDRLNNFTILDSSEHPAPRGAYLMATAVYARIFGRSELASSENATNYIKLYNVKGNSFKGAITHALYSDGGGKTVKGKTVYHTAKDYAMSVDAAYARKIQSTVYNNYSSYIKNCSVDNCRNSYSNSIE